MGVEKLISAAMKREKIDSSVRQHETFQSLVSLFICVITAATVQLAVEFQAATKCGPQVDTAAHTVACFQKCEP